LRVLIKGVDLVGGSVIHLMMAHESRALVKAREELDFTALDNRPCKEFLEPLRDLVNSIRTNPEKYQGEESSQGDVLALEKFLGEILMTAWNHHDAKIFIQS
jgi:hypothetical protein